VATAGGNAPRPACRRGFVLRNGRATRPSGHGYARTCRTSLAGATNGTLRVRKRLCTRQTRPATVAPSSRIRSRHQRMAVVLGLHEPQLVTGLQECHKFDQGGPPDVKLVQMFRA